MNLRSAHPRQYVASLWGRYAAPQWMGMRRIARALRVACSLSADELRRLNRIGADAGSRGERVRIVKQTLANHGKGSNRCC